jgi:hypothetical protein
MRQDFKVKLYHKRVLNVLKILSKADVIMFLQRTNINANQINYFVVKILLYGMLFAVVSIKHKIVSTNETHTKISFIYWPVNFITGFLFSKNGFK